MFPEILACVFYVLISFPLYVWVIYKVAFLLMVIFFVSALVVWYESTNLGICFQESAAFCVYNGQSYVNLSNYFLIPFAKIKNKKRILQFKVFQNSISVDILPLWGCQRLNSLLGRWAGGLGATEAAKSPWTRGVLLAAPHTASLASAPVVWTTFAALDIHVCWLGERSGY